VSKSAAQGRIRVWDLPTRLFHWLLVGLFAFLWYSGGGSDALMDWHMRAGYALLALLLFRVAWGIWGSRHSRFVQFLTPPRQTLAYLRELLARRTTPAFGHNPLGGWMVMMMLAALLVQTITGLFATDDISINGPLNGAVSSTTAGRLTDVHHLNFDILLILAGLHIAAILAHRVLGEPLTLAMVTGRQRANGPHTDEPFAPLWRAVVLAALAGLAVYLVVGA
jgi:cytochrome b